MSLLIPRNHDKQVNKNWPFDIYFLIKVFPWFQENFSLVSIISIDHWFLYQTTSNYRVLLEMLFYSEMEFDWEQGVTSLMNKPVKCKLPYRSPTYAWNHSCQNHLSGPYYGTAAPKCRSEPQNWGSNWIHQKSPKVLEPSPADRNSSCIRIYVVTLLYSSK